MNLKEMLKKFIVITEFDINTKNENILKHIADYYGSKSIFLSELEEIVGRDIKKEEKIELHFCNATGIFFYYFIESNIYGVDSHIREFTGTKNEILNVIVEKLIPDLFDILEIEDKYKKAIEKEMKKKISNFLILKLY